MEQTIFQKSPFRLSGVLRGHSAEIRCLRFSFDGSLLASVQDASNEVWIWNINSQMLLQKMPGSDMAFSPDGSVLAVIDDGITLWECATWRCLERLPFHPTFIEFSSDGKALITMDALGRFSIFDVATKQTVFAFDALVDLSRPGWPAISPDSSCLALPTSSNQAHLWLFDHASHEALYLDMIPADFEEGLAFSPDGAFLATLVAGKTRQRVRLYHVASQHDLGHLDPDVGSPWKWKDGFFDGRKRPQAVAFSPESTYLVVAAPDGVLLLWHVPEHRLITSFAAHPDPAEREVLWGPSDGLWSVAWSPSRNLLATGGWHRATQQLDYITSYPIKDGEFLIKLWSVQFS